MAIETVVEDSTPFDLLTRLGADAAQVVLGQHHLSIRERIPDASLGSELAAALDCPVVIVPPGLPGNHGARPPVVVALDGETDAHAALEIAFDEAELRRLMVIALHAAPLATLPSHTTDDERDLAEILAGWKADHPDVVVQTLVTPAEPTELIIQASRNAALMVVGRPHEPGLGAWSRSVAGAVLKLAHCPLVIAPGGGAPGRPASRARRPGRAAATAHRTASARGSG
jgi:nucleotide-binding universal stress UspA family protein